MCSKLAGSIRWLWIGCLSFLRCQVAGRGRQFAKRRLWAGLMRCSSLLTGVLSALVSVALQTDRGALDDSAPSSSSLDSTDGVAISISSMTGVSDDSGFSSGSRLPAPPAGSSSGNSPDRGLRQSEDASRPPQRRDEATRRCTRRRHGRSPRNGDTTTGSGSPLRGAPRDHIGSTDA